MFGEVARMRLVLLTVYRCSVPYGAVRSTKREPGLGCGHIQLSYDIPVFGIETPPGTDYSVRIRAPCWIVLPAFLYILPNLRGESAPFSDWRFFWSLPTDDHENSCFVSYVTERQLSSVDLDAQHRERENICLFRSRGLLVFFLSRWIDKFWG